MRCGSCFCLIWVCWWCCTSPTSWWPWYGCHLPGTSSSSSSESNLTLSSGAVHGRNWKWEMFLLILCFVTGFSAIILVPLIVVNMYRLGLNCGINSFTFGCLTITWLSHLMLISGALSCVLSFAGYTRLVIGFQCLGQCYGYFLIKSFLIFFLNITSAGAALVEVCVVLWYSKNLCTSSWVTLCLVCSESIIFIKVFMDDLTCSLACGHNFVTHSRRMIRCVM